MGEPEGHWVEHVHYRGAPLIFIYFLVVNKKERIDLSYEIKIEHSRKS